jgi:hypothetical protein
VHVVRARRVAVEAVLRQAVRMMATALLCSTRKLRRLKFWRRVERLAHRTSGDVGATQTLSLLDTGRLLE